MATAPVLPPLSVQEYEQTPALFDRHEYVDGRLIERTVPTWKHSQLQIWIGALLMRYAASLAIGSELHSKLREGNWRIPDVAAQRREITEQEKYAHAPLLLAIEIRSPEDRPSAILAKFEEYHEWGVPFCWLLDPETERAWTYHRGQDFNEVAESDAIQAGEIQLPVAEIFSIFHR